MRLVRLALALSLAAALPAPGAAQVSLPPLAPGEVLLEVSGLGQVTTRADFAVLDAMAVGQAGDRPAAVRIASEKLARAVAAVRVAGIPAQDVQAGDVITAGAAGLSTPQVVLAAAYGDGAGSETVSLPLRVTIRDISRLEAVRAALVAGQAPTYAPPQYFLTDSTGPFREARAAALRRARIDAEANAALRNMRIVRIARISERGAQWAVGQVANEAETVSRLFSMVWRVHASSEVETFASVAVDFVLAPR